jgi:hypothetical protein
MMTAAVTSPDPAWVNYMLDFRAIAAVAAVVGLTYRWVCDIESLKRVCHLSNDYLSSIETDFKIEKWTEMFISKTYLKH